MTHSTHLIYSYIIYVVSDMVNVHSNNEKGNLLLPLYELPSLISHPLMVAGSIPHGGPIELFLIPAMSEV